MLVRRQLSRRGSFHPRRLKMRGNCPWRSRRQTPLEQADVRRSGTTLVANDDRIAARISADQFAAASMREMLAIPREDLVRTLL
jgi:hypothetical protein